MSKVGRLHVYYEDKFWGKEDYIALDSENYSLWVPISDTGMLFHITYDNETVRMESLSDDEIKAEIKQLFESMFGTLHPGYDFTPTAVSMSKWVTKENFAGSYSYNKVGRTASWEDI